MRTSLLCLMLLVACDGDSDNDGLSNARERELGTSTAIRDTDRDGLDDGEEVLEHGTDPLSPDTDIDGFEDAEEVDAGSDPLDPFSYPTDRWPDLRDRLTDEGERGWGDGQHAPNWRGTDQRGESLEIDRLYGHVLILQLMAGEFCGACGAMAAEAQALQSERAGEGVFVVHVLVDDDSRDGDIDNGFAATWAERHDLDFPTVVSPEAATGLFEAGIYDGRIPLTLLLDRSHIVQGSWQGADSLTEAEDRLDALVGQAIPGD